MKYLIPFFILLIAVTAVTVSAQEIAFTFDDAPTHDGPLFSGEERTRRIIGHLKKERIQAAFFVITQNIDATGDKRLADYSAAGHLLANHSHTHGHIHQLGISSYVKDIRKADSILKTTYPAYEPWFRYPFLDEGRTVQARDSIRRALAEFGLANGYVTVDNYDWYLNNLLRIATQEGKQVNTEIMRKIYLDHVFESITFYDSIAATHLGRSPRHVLLLHENDLAAMFLGDLIDLVKQKGWKIISPTDAYHDPIARMVPDVLFNGQGRIAALARAKGIPARQLVQKSEDEVFLDELTKQLKAFE